MKQNNTALTKLNWEDQSHVKTQPTGIFVKHMF